MRPKKAQGSFEFLMLVGVASIAAIIFLLASSQDIYDLSQKKEFLLLKDQGDRIEREISLAVQVEDGYQRSFKVPLMLENREYGIIITNRTLTLWTDQTSYAVRIPEIIGNVSKGTNSISKENGLVRLN